MQLASLMSPGRGESRTQQTSYNEDIRKGSEYLGAREDEEDEEAES